MTLPSHDRSPKVGHDRDRHQTDPGRHAERGRRPPFPSAHPRHPQLP